MKIILATDGTKYSDSAIDMISNLSISKVDQINIISVIDMALPLSMDMYAGYLPNTAELEQIARDNALKTLENTKKSIGLKLNNPEIIINTDILIGSPDSRIVEYAEDIKANLIIVGSHGYNRWERLLLGSVSDSVVHHAPCSVLVVRNSEV